MRVTIAHSKTKPEAIQAVDRAMLDIIQSFGHAAPHDFKFGTMWRSHQPLGNPNINHDWLATQWGYSSVI
jgi:hypothetical protein